MALNDYGYQIPQYDNTPNFVMNNNKVQANTGGGGNTATAVGAGLEILSKGAAAYYGAQAQKALLAKEEAQRAAARGYLDGYGYKMYDSPYQSFYDQYVNTYLTGGLSQGQERALETARAQGMSNINSTMANRGGGIGGQLAMAQKNNADIAYLQSQMVDRNADTGMNLAQNRDKFNLQQWLEKNQAEMKYKELMAQYA